jgi:ribosome-associated protein
MATKKKTTKKTAKKATSAKKAASTKKASSKKAVPKKAAPKKAAKKATSTKKAAAKKAAPKKAAPKKAAKAAPKKGAKAAPKKAAAKKAPATTKKAPAKKAAPNKATAAKLHDAVETIEAVETFEAVEAPAVEPQAHVSHVDEPAPAPARPALKTPKVSLPPDPTIDLAQAVAALALDKKADDVVILKVSDLTSYADCFILASAPSERQVQAIARHVGEEMKKAGKAPVGTEGLEQGHWVLVDLGAVVLHVFLSSARQYYDLEGFWSDAPRIEVDEKRGLDTVAAMTAENDERRAAAANE